MTLQLHKMFSSLGEVTCGSGQLNPNLLLEHQVNWPMPYPALVRRWLWHNRYFLWGYFPTYSVSHISHPMGLLGSETVKLLKHFQAVQAGEGGGRIWPKWPRLVPSSPSPRLLCFLPVIFVSAFCCCSGVFLLMSPCLQIEVVQQRKRFSTSAAIWENQATLNAML